MPRLMKPDIVTVGPLTFGIDPTLPFDGLVIQDNRGNLAYESNKPSIKFDWLLYACQELASDTFCREEVQLRSSVMDKLLGRLYGLVTQFDAVKQKDSFQRPFVPDWFYRTIPVNKKTMLKQFCIQSTTPKIITDTMLITPTNDTFVHYGQWGEVFNDVVYIDTSTRSSAFENSSEAFQMFRQVCEELVTDKHRNDRQLTVRYLQHVAKELDKLK